MRVFLVPALLTASCFGQTLGTWKMNAARSKFVEDPYPKSVTVHFEAHAILRKCASGEWTRFVRRLAPQPKEPILEVTEQHPHGRRFERRLALEKPY
jgi:hypothetical protein